MVERERKARRLRKAMLLPGGRFAGAGWLALLAAATAVSLPAPANAVPVAAAGSETSSSTAAVKAIETAVTDWPHPARALARLMIERYGPPDSAGAEALVWNNVGSSWKRTTVHRRAPPASTGRPVNGCLEETIDYQVPIEKIIVLKRFDERVSVDASRGELSCRSESESTNFLLMNLAVELINESRGVESAQAFLSETQRLARSGKYSPFTSGFLFRVMK
jgi:hypothetical protein